MKMLISYLYCNKGGVTSVIKQRMPVLRKNGWLVDTAFMDDHGGGMDLIAAGVNEVQIFRNNFTKDVQQLIQSRNYDLHVIFDTPELMRINIPEKTRMIFEIHTPILSTIKKYHSAGLEKSDYIFVPSKWSKATVLQLIPTLKPELIRVLPNIVETSVFNTDGLSFPYSNTLLWIGKLAEYKNWEEAMQIGGAFLEQHPGWNFMAVTGGLKNDDLVARMITEFISRGQVSRFKWLHNLSQAEIGCLYRGVAQNGGFLLSTSKAESFCLVVHEAMRCGLPVVSTRVGPIPEVIEDQVSGLLYEQGNVTECLTKCNMLLSPNIRERILAGGAKALMPFDQPLLEALFIEEINKAIAG